jgi:hypothetical protein
VLPKMASGSGKRSRLHRGFSKGSVPSQHQSLRRGLRVLGLCRQQLGRAIAWLRCALCRVSTVKAAQVGHLPPISLQAIDGRHAASDSRKPAGESCFGELMCRSVCANAWAHQRGLVETSPGAERMNAGARDDFAVLNLGQIVLISFPTLGNEVPYQLGNELLPFEVKLIVPRDNPLRGVHDRRRGLIAG